MAFRGRGRGRGGGMGGGFAKQEPYILFPEDVTLPNIIGMTNEEKLLIRWNEGFRSWWGSSPYYLEEAGPTKREDIDIERFSDRGKPKGRAKRDPLSNYLKLTPNNFPRELIQGSRRTQQDQRKVRWDLESGLNKLDHLEKLEAKIGDKDEKEKKEGEDEDTDVEVDVEEEDFSDDGDYNRNMYDYDDDEDDFNMADDGDDEGGTY
ncbi:hypothetical protein ACHQM5_006220 [Ranunculus cassubicifolius]